MSELNVFSLGLAKHVSLTHILNPLDVRHRTISNLPYVAGQTLGDYVADTIDGEEYIASVNGQIIEGEDFTRTILLEGDSVVLCPVILKGSGTGKSILRLAAMITLSWAIGPASAGGLGWGASAAGAMGITSGLGIAMVSGTMMMAGSMLVNAVFSPATTNANLTRGTGAGDGVVKMSTGAVSQASGPGSDATYSYQGAKSTQGEGGPVALCYGGYIHGGHLIEVFVDSEGQSQTLYALFSAGEGELAGLSDIMVNDSPLSDYAVDGLRSELRLGTSDQAPIGWFDRQVSTVAINQGITERGAPSPTRTTTRMVDKLRFSIAFPSGLAGYNRKGDTLGASASFLIQYRKTGTTEWVSINKTFSAAARSSLRFQVSTEKLETAYYECRVQYIGSSIAMTAAPINTTNDTQSASEGPIGEQYALTNYGAGVGLQGARYPDGSVLVSGFDGAMWVKKDESGAVTVVDSGTGPNSFSLVAPPKGYTTTAIDDSSIQIDFNTDASEASKFKISTSQGYYDANGNPLQDTYYDASGEVVGAPVIDDTAEQIWAGAGYDGGSWMQPYKIPEGGIPGATTVTAGRPTVTIRVGAPSASTSNADGTAELYQLYDKATDAYWGDVEEIITDPVSYIHTALVGLQIPIVGNRISGLPNITFKNHGKLISVWDKVNNAWVQEASNNPAWIMYDMLTNTRYGAGISVASVDVEKLKAWADFCATEELTFNGVFDTQQNIWDSLQYVLKAGHATLLRIGTRYTVTIEQESQPVMMFSQANMLEGSYSETWLPTADRANEIELSYFAADDKYKQKTIKVFDPRIIGSGRPVRATSATLYGVTDGYRAFLEGVMLLNMNRYILKTCEFDAPVEALACTVGDVIYVASAMTDWGYSGRLMAGTTTSVLSLDTPVVVDPSKQYKALVHVSAARRLTSTVLTIVQGSSMVQLASFPSESYKRLRMRSKGIDVAATATSSLGWVSVDTTAGLEVGDTVDLIDTDIIAERDVINDPSWVSGSVATSLTLATPLIGYSESLMTPKSEMTKDADDVFEDFEGSHFMFGESSRVKQKFRVSSITGSAALVRHIAAVQYDERVYTLDSSLFANVATTLNDMRAYPATNLQAVETIYTVGTEHKSRVNFSWNAPRKMLLDYYEATISDYNSPDTKATIRIESGGRSVVAEVYDDAQPGIWDISVVAVAMNGLRSAPVSTVIHVNGAAKYVSAIGMPAPVDPRFTLNLDAYGNSTTSISVNTGAVLDSRGIVPDGMVLFLSTEKSQNALKITSGGVGTSLLVGGADFVQGSFNFSSEVLLGMDIAEGYNYVELKPQILAGSTRDYIKLLPDNTTTPFDVNGLKLEGRYWVTHNGTEFRCATKFDDFGMFIDPPFMSVPTPGALLDWFEMGFHDQRAYEFRMGFLRAPGSSAYEVIRWEAMEQTINGIELTGVERGIEGTTPINATGCELHYYPAYGPGTFTEVLKVADGDFKLDSSGPEPRFIASKELMIPLQDMTWASATCCTYAIVDGQIIRSPIVPISYVLP